MKRASSGQKLGGGRASGKNGVVNNNNREIEWELRPGGMLVQKRDVNDESSSSSEGPLIKIKVSHGSYHHVVTLPAQSSFGELKRVLANETGLQPKEQRLLFRGKEKDDDELLHMAGVTDMFKVILMEDPASKERKLQEINKDKVLLKACDAVAKVRAEVDKLGEKVVALESCVRCGTKIADSEFVVLTESLMLELLNLDAIEADGEAKVQRRTEVRRVQSFVDTLDHLKARNLNPFTNSTNAVSVTTKWERFESGVGSLNAPTTLQSSTRITRDWELFD